MMAGEQERRGRMSEPMVPSVDIGTQAVRDRLWQNKVECDGVLDLLCRQVDVAAVFGPGKMPIKAQAGQIFSRIGA